MWRAIYIQADVLERCIREELAGVLLIRLS